MTHVLYSHAPRCPWGLSSPTHPTKGLQGSPIRCPTSPLDLQHMMWVENPGVLQTPDGHPGPKVPLMAKCQISDFRLRFLAPALPDEGTGLSNGNLCGAELNPTLNRGAQAGLLWHPACPEARCAGGNALTSKQAAIPCRDVTQGSAQHQEPPAVAVLTPVPRTPTPARPAAPCPSPGSKHQIFVPTALSLGILPCLF